ncbi:ganglioside-induced differentiation-associated protein 2 isoform X1 [Ornithorhynchus anatinus]|uniref:ganglioside-induced differentiation-associated protein 2 isoform X1 n=1 Tax=Ornithorhynchus anatinus TaxID=9258 RepID=UPI0010A79B5E|nr:ganglioside-induced differentiation-associated protein 2 isoform X1 [Ornithorhynchus anatinus]
MAPGRTSPSLGPGPPGGPRRAWPMDPLGAPSQFVDVDTLPSWMDSFEPGEPDPRDPFPGGCPRSPFPCNRAVGGKVVLWKGDVALLNCTAIVNTSNESLSDKNPVSESICALAGPDLLEDLQKLKGCRTGEAKLTKGFNLAARFIIHTVGPKYKSRYRTAAESSLYSCYWNVLQLTKEQAMSSVGFCVINSAKRGYPLEDATHIALRTVRRFLEAHGDTIEKVVFAVSDLEEATYRKLLPLYFPRSLEEEARSLPLLPADIGNAQGEPVVPERQIRISEKPGAPEDPRAAAEEDEEEDGLEVGLSFVGSHAFARMEEDVDKQRRLVLQGQLSEAALQKQHQRNYNRWLCQARAEDLSDIASLKALYQTGVDNCGRTVMVVVGRNIPVTLIDMDKALLYFIHVMDHIVVKEYVLVYFHTLTSDYNRLDSDFLKKLYDVVDAKYKRNLKAVYFVHPTFRSKVATWFFTTFSVSGLKDKVHQVESLHQLFAAIAPEQIDFPPFVLEYDARENGPCYSSGPPSPDL